MGAGLTLECAAQVGCVLAAYVVERIGTQEYSFTPEEFLGPDVRRVRRSGSQPSREMAPGVGFLPNCRPCGTNEKGAS